MKPRLLAIAVVVIAVAALVFFNSLLLLTPVRAGTCIAECPGGGQCSCSGAQCTATDNWGCSGGDGTFPNQQCRCTKSIN